MSKRLLEIYENSILLRPVTSIAFVILIAIAMAFGLPNFKLDASADSLTLENDTALAYYRESLQKYGSSDFLVVTYTPYTGDLFDDKSLQTLDKMHKELEKVDGVASVLSMMNVPLLYSPKITVSQLKDPPRTLSLPNIDRDMVRKEFLESPIYKNLILSKDGQTTAILATMKLDNKYLSLVNARDTLRIKRDADGLTSKETIELEDVSKKFLDYRTLRAAEERERVADIRERMSKFKGDAQVFLGGPSMITADMVDFIKSDLKIFGAGILLFIIATLAVIFRQLRWVVLPLITCVLAVEIILGYLSWIDWRLTVISSNFVSLLLIITLALTIHLIVRYRELLRDGPDRSQLDLVRDTVRHMILPCVYTVLTTVVAFVSLVVSDIRPVIDFGWMMTMGIILALFLAFIIIPAGMMILGKAKNTDSGDNSASFTLRFSNFTEKFGGVVLSLALIAGIASAWGISQLQVENRFIDYFRSHTEIHQGLALIDEKLGGTTPLEIILNAPPAEDDGSLGFDEIMATSGDSSTSAADDPYGDPFGGAYENSGEEDISKDKEAYDPFAGMYEDEENAPVSENEEAYDPFAGMYEDEEFTESTDSFADSDIIGVTQVDVVEDSYWLTSAGIEDIRKIHLYLESLPEIGKVDSLVTVTDVASDLSGHKLNDLELAFMSLMLSQENKELLLDPYIDEKNNQTRITMRVNETQGELNRQELLERIRSYAINDAGFTEEQVNFTGILVLYNNMLQSLFHSQIMTMGTVFLGIMTMFMILFRSISISLIAITPNFLAAGVVLGGMGIAGIPLDMMTITIAAITVGIGVDHAIHYITRFKREFEVDRDYVASMHRAHASIGRALFYTAITIIMGFSILALSNFIPSVYFGLLTALAMLAALLGSMTLLPKLILIFKPLGK
ncbi:MMPL family transporter [Porticoccus sp.]|nr:MMPL family transporter [Gammaproteobacteria bacterium]MDA7737581.1 MMPL family transporter [Porticoccus sp.]